MSNLSPPSPRLHPWLKSENPFSLLRTVGTALSFQKKPQSAPLQQAEAAANQTS